MKRMRNQKRMRGGRALDLATPSRNLIAGKDECEAYESSGTLQKFSAYQDRAIFCLTFFVSKEPQQKI
jgi:hypothetical protein